MKNIEEIKKELINFCKKYNACKKDIESIKGNNLTELFQNIGKYIYWCKSDKEFTFDKEKTNKFNAIFDNELVIENNVLLCNCSGLTFVIIPDSVTSIGDYAFFDCIELTSIKIPNSIYSIGKNAFDGCIKLTSIEIPDSVISIGSGAFSYCIELTSVTIPNSVVSIGDFAFFDCSGLTSIVIPNSITSINSNIFYKCNKNLKIIRK